LEELLPADKKAVEAAEQIWRPLGELLVEKGLVSRDELELALTEHEASGRPLGAILVERGYIAGPALAIALAEQHGVELKSDRGFGTGLWAEISRRHRSVPAESSEDNVVQLGQARLAPLEAVDERPNPALALVQAENSRLREELRRLREMPARPRMVEAPERPSSHVLFVPTPKGYRLLEREGAPPEAGEEVELPQAGGVFGVTRLGRAPFPGERRPCAFLAPR
jgi:hypothetical protein